MSTLIYPQERHDFKIWRPVALSLALHLFVVLLYPKLSQMQLPAVPPRIEIELFTNKAPTTAVQQASPIETPAEPPKVEPKPLAKSLAKPPTPMEAPKPVLATPSSTDSDYRVREQPPQPAKVELAPALPAPTNQAETVPRATVSSNESTAKETKSSAAPAHTVATTADSDELSASESDAWGDYGEQLRTLVNKSKQYPAIAIRRHLEGEATVIAQFVRGELVNVSLAESSKQVPLDEEAMRMVKKAIAQLSLKDSLKKKSFKITIPVDFKLE